MNRGKLLVSAAALALTNIVTQGEEAPTFYKDTFPEHALEAKMEAEAVLAGEHAKLDAKTRELVALAVAAQIPCTYCVYYHLKAAKAAGASEAEIREAVARAAHVRHWSTILNGMAYDFDAFKAELDQMMDNQE